MLYIVKPTKEGEVSLGYDTAYGFVVRAHSEIEARALAASRSGDEGKEMWLDPDFVTCEELSHDGEPGVILRDYLSG